MTKIKDKPRGRMSSYAFFVQRTREDYKREHPHENVVFSEFSKKCSEAWKTMSDSDKQEYVNLANDDKKRYDYDMATYVPPKKKTRRTKDPNAPKRALSAFFWYCNEHRAKIRDELPPGTTGVGEVAKECARRWNSLNTAGKSKYEALAAKDRARYEKEIAVYKQNASNQNTEDAEADSDSDD